MFFIVMHHGIVHGLGLDGLSSWGGELLVTHQDMLIVSLVNSCLIFAVNAFVLITGYFSLNLKKEKVIKLLTPALIYTLLFATIPLLSNAEYVSAVKSLFFLSQGPYWFILDYLFLMVLTPVINDGYSKLNKHRSLVLIGLLLVINCYFGFLWGDKVNNNGYTLMQFVLMYIIGRHIRIHGFNLSKQWVLSCFILTSIINGILFYIVHCLGYGGVAWKLTFYNNPLVIIGAISFFVLFLNIRIKSKVINYLSASALAIYLIQNTPLVSKWYYQTVADYHMNNESIWLSLGIIAILSFVICCASICLDKICVPAFSKIYNCFNKHSEILKF